MTVFQPAKGLTDRRAADAVRDRLSWMYTLSPDLGDTGFDAGTASDESTNWATHPAKRHGSRDTGPRVPNTGLVAPGLLYDPRE
ncbi:transposase [Kitasatospora sp. NPDC004615]|uniref:transposase n=1 Tax=Kitasatospora sp. NPDC004615 TaxID=3364017 RepID=UPI0036BE32E5